MSRILSALSPEVFRQALAACSPEPLDEPAVHSLYRHYLELVRWSGTLSLIGPGTADEVVARHYGEALAALPLIPRRPGELVDLGSGAGFPGLVLAAARPELAVTLVEARERKWSFLLAAARRASLPCRCLNARVGSPLPTGFPGTIDLVTARALKLPAEILAALAGRLPSQGRILLWLGEEDPDLPPDLLPDRELKLAGSECRRILELRRLDRPVEPTL